MIWRQRVEENLGWCDALSCKAFGRAAMKSIFSSDDFIQAGRLGLIQAAKKYSPGKNDCFRAYAYRRIQGSIMDEIRTVEGRRKGMRTQHEVQMPLLDREGTIVMSRKMRERIHERDLSLDAKLDLDQFLSMLDERERFVVTQYSLKDRTQVDIGQDLHITNGRVSQILAGAMSKMRATL